MKSVEEMETVTIQYSIPTLFLIGEKKTRLFLGGEEEEEPEECIKEILRQPFCSVVLFPDLPLARFSRVTSYCPIKKVFQVEFSIPSTDDKEGKYCVLNTSYLIPGKLSKTRTGLPPLILFGVERKNIWRLIESDLFRDYIYKEMINKLPSGENKYQIKLKELSLEYGELVFSLQF